MIKRAENIDFKMTESTTLNEIELKILELECFCKKMKS